MGYSISSSRNRKFYLFNLSSAYTHSIAPSASFLAPFVLFCNFCIHRTFCAAISAISHAPSAFFAPIRVAWFLHVSFNFRTCPSTCRLHFLTNLQVSSAPPGTQAATLDIEAAYRTIPVWPPHKKFLVVGFEGLFWIDHTFPFGLTTAGGVQGHVADATVDILAKLDVSPIKKWVDDHSIFRYPSSGGETLPDGSTAPYQYLFGLIQIYDKSRPLGVPWHPKKWTDFAFVFIYLGFLWNLTDRSVTLPEPKRMKYLGKVSDLLLALRTSSGRPGKMSCADAMSINGTLSHISFVIPHGRSYLANLSHFIAGFPEHARHASHHPAPSVVSDLEWWRAVLSTPPVPRQLVSRGLPQDIDLWVDASTDWGIGLIFRGRWNAWMLIKGWKGSGRDIGWLEAVAVELAIITLFSAGWELHLPWVHLLIVLLGWRDCAVIIHSDNQGVIGSFKCGRSRNFQVNLCIRRSEVIAMHTNVSHVLSYTESTSNKADPISRGEVGPPSARLPHIQLPSELRDFITSYV